MRQSSAVTGPTWRCLWPSEPSAPRLLSEIGTSPTPYAVSIANCPGSRSNGSPAGGSSPSGHVSAVSRSAGSSWTAHVSPLSRPRLRPAYGAGTIGPGETRRGSTAMSVSIEISEPEPGRVQALEEHRREALHQLLAERG